MKQQVEQDGIYCRVVPGRTGYMVVTARHGYVVGARLGFSMPEPEGPTSGLTLEEAERMQGLWEEFLSAQDGKGRDKYDPKRKKQF